MTRMDPRVLVLNASYEPLQVCTARRAVVLVLKGTARMEESTERVWHTGRALVLLCYKLLSRCRLSAGRAIWRRDEWCGSGQNRTG